MERRENGKEEDREEGKRNVAKKELNRYTGMIKSTIYNSNIVMLTSSCSCICTMLSLLSLTHTHILYFVYMLLICWMVLIRHSKIR